MTVHLHDKRTNASLGVTTSILQASTNLTICDIYNRTQTLSGFLRVFSDESLSSIVIGNQLLTPVAVPRNPWQIKWPLAHILDSVVVVAGVKQEVIILAAHE